MLNWSASPLSKVLHIACSHIGVVIGDRVVGEVHVGGGKERVVCVCVCVRACMRAYMRAHACVCQEQVEYTLLQLKRKKNF